MDTIGNPKSGPDIVLAIMRGLSCTRLEPFWEYAFLPLIVLRNHITKNKHFEGLPINVVFRSKRHGFFILEHKYFELFGLFIIFKRRYSSIVCLKRPILEGHNYCSGPGNKQRMLCLNSNIAPNGIK